jgi:hypothetical protein
MIFGRMLAKKFRYMIIDDLFKIHAFRVVNNRKHLLIQERFSLRAGVAGVRRKKSLQGTTQ